MPTKTALDIREGVPDPYLGPDATEAELMAAIDGLRALFPNGFLREGETVQDYIDQVRERDPDD